MKRILLILLTAAALFAQESVKSDSIDIRSLVNEQISKIKEQESKAVSTNNAVKVNKAQILSGRESKFNITAKDFISYAVFFLVELVLAASLIFLWIKRKEINNKYAVKYLKLNIAKLRSERIGTKFNNDLTKLRTTLVGQTINVNDPGRDITYKAKKYSISKGEVHLAAKLKILAEKSR